MCYIILCAGNTIMNKASPFLNGGYFLDWGGLGLGKINE